MAKKKPSTHGAAPGDSPPAPQILIARTTAGLTQAEAARVVHSTARRWREWEAGEHRMHPGLWELFVLKTKGTVLIDGR